MAKIMEFRSHGISGLVEIVPKKIADERGYFSEIFRQSMFEEHIGNTDFVQDNQSLSRRVGTVRGIHFQTPPFAQAKLVRCISGAAFDVAVDLRHGSSTFGRWAAVTLSSAANNQLWIPAGFGHGFCTLEPDTIIHYRVTRYYSAEHDKGVAWDDAHLAIEWPDVADPETLSSKDRVQPSLSELTPVF